jgi:hypothetical protein
MRRRSSLLLTFLFIASFLLLSRVYKNMVALHTFGDAELYWAFPRSLVYDFDLDFSNEPLETFERDPSYINYMSPTPGYLWLPAVAAGRLMGPLFAKLPGAEPEKVRLGVSDYHRLFIDAYSAALTLAGLLFVLQVLRRWFPPRASLAAAFVLLIGTPLFYFTFRRPMMAHSAEIFTLGLFMWTSLRFVDAPNRLSAFWMGLTAGLAAIVRYPNVFIICAWLAGLAFTHREVVRRLTPGIVAASLAGAFIPYAVLLVTWKISWGTWLPHRGTYSMKPSHLGLLLSIRPVTLYRLWLRIAGPGWGLVWTETPFLLALWMTIRAARNEQNSLMRWTALGIIPLLLVASNYPTQGGSYGFRYLLAKAPWMSLGLAAFWARYEDRKALLALFCASVVLPIFFTLYFELGPANLTLHAAPAFDDGRPDWINNHFVLEAVRTFIQNPLTLFHALSGTPIGHLAVVLAAKTPLLSALPDAVQAKAMERLGAIPLAEFFWYVFWVCAFSALWCWFFTRYVSKRHKATA